jgi:CO/xanthine dehydrogenase Mo-binding subunit
MEPIVSPMAAVANAVAMATGARIGQLPMSPGVVLEAAREQTARN